MNGLAKEYNYSNNTKDGKAIDKSNTKNYNYGSDNSGDIDNNDARDGNSSNSDSSNSDEGNKAYGYIGQRESLAPISSRLKPKRSTKYYL